LSFLEAIADIRHKEVMPSLKGLDGIEAPPERERLLALGAEISLMNNSWLSPAIFQPTYETRAPKPLHDDIVPQMCTPAVGDPGSKGRRVAWK